MAGGVCWMHPLYGAVDWPHTCVPAAAGSPCHSPEAPWGTGLHLVLTPALTGWSLACRADFPLFLPCSTVTHLGWCRAPHTLSALCVWFAGSVQISSSLHRPVGAAVATRGIAGNHSISANNLWAKSMCLAICAPKSSYGHSCYSHESPGKPNAQAINSICTPPHTETLKWRERLWTVSSPIKTSFNSITAIQLFIHLCLPPGLWTYGCMHHPLKTGQS